MNKILQDIFDSRKVSDEKGRSYDLHSNTSQDQCLFLQELIREIKPERSIEIGLAYGISSLAILEALEILGKPFRHSIIDPFQGTFWNNVGLFNIKKAGFANQIAFFEKFSFEVLPVLHQDRERIQFAYIDSTKVFDNLMVDAFFLNLMLDVGGVLVFDDCGYPGIRKIASFLSVHPGFKVLRGYGEDQDSLKKRIVSNLNRGILNVLPFKKRTIPGYNFQSDKTRNINYNCIAFQKIAEDNRNWDWFQPF